MKKFTDIKESKKTQEKDSIKNEIINILEELNIKMSGEDTEKLSNIDINIEGKEQIIEKLKTLINGVRIQERKNTLNFVKSNSFRNFNMNWLNEQIDGLNKIKIGNEIILNEKLSNSSLTNDYRAALKEYFATNLNGENIDGWEFNYDEKAGVFNFVNGKGASIKATPFWNSPDTVTIEIEVNDEILDEKKINLNVEEIVYRKYLNHIRDALNFSKEL